jgi:hypothetical protein
MGRLSHQQMGKMVQKRIAVARSGHRGLKLQDQEYQLLPSSLQ